MERIKKRGYGSIKLNGRTFYLEKEGDVWIGWYHGGDDDITEGATPEQVIEEAQ